ncbi:MAG TPA: DUF4173 domain-containing protein [Roseiflexaceae bacterium]|nr:DUF4173 domain-containing protein [Roseiflexaceae bacterium]
MQPSLRSPLLVFGLALALGVSADRLFSGRWLGISVPLFVTALLLVLFGLGRREGIAPTRANLWLSGAALFFAGLVAVRDNQLLVTLNVLAVLGLLLLQAALYRGPAIGRLSVGQTMLSALDAGVNIAYRAAPLTGQALQAAPVQRGQLAAVMPLARGLALSVPVLLVFGGLLVSADTVFASYVNDMFRFDWDLDLASLFGHTLTTLGVAWACAGGLVVALTGVAAPAAPKELPAEGDTQRLAALPTSWRFLGWVEALTVLSLVDLLFAVFMLIQGAYLFGGMATLDRTNMTFADYARRGFFELLAVACLSLALLWCLALITKRDQQQTRIFNLASGAMVVLVIGMLLSAFQRMLLYEQAYGFTELRIYTHSFMIWLAVVLGLFLVALVRDRPRVFVLGSFVTALVYLALLNLADTDALIVRANVARYEQTGKLDAWYLTTLSADSVPDLVAAYSKVDPVSQETLRNSFAWRRARLQEETAKQGWPAWRLSRSRALAALEQAP